MSDLVPIVHDPEFKSGELWWTLAFSPADPVFGKLFEAEPHRHATLDDLRAMLAALSAEQLEYVLPEQLPLRGVK